MLRKYAGFVISFSVFALGLFQSGCANKSNNDPACDCAYDISLPIPNKIERRGSGLSPTKYSISVDFSTGLTEYERKNGLDESDSCNGSLTLGDEIEAWKEAIKQKACTRVLEQAISDGFLNTMKFYYSPGAIIPDSIVATSVTEGTSVELLEKFSDSVPGKQQFDCRGSFAIDSLINDKIPCLKLE